MGPPRFWQVLPAIAFAASVSGCASSAIEAGTSRLVGQPLSAAIAKLGLPTDERVIAGQKVHIWASSRLVEGTTSACQIRAIMQGDLIGSFDYDGNNGACMRYAMVLRQ